MSEIPWGNLLIALNTLRQKLLYKTYRT